MKTLPAERSWRLKICGIRDEAFALAAAQAGVDYLGFIFAPASPRKITIENAQNIAAKLTGQVRLCGVFTSSPVEEILDTAEKVPLDLIQLHGDYSVEDAAVLKASGYEVWALDGTPASKVASKVLLDGVKNGVRGGTGVKADWERVGELRREGREVVLAGGIGENNILDALQTGAEVVDVNSSLEEVRGVKSIALLKRLIARLNP